MPIALTATRPAEDPRPLREAAARISGYRWIVLTSARAVAPLLDALTLAGTAPDEVRRAGVRVCAVGPSTADASSDAGLPPDLVPERFAAEGIVEALVHVGREGSTGVSEGLVGSRVLFPRAQGGRDLIPGELRAAGASVDLVTAYRTVPDEAGADRLVGLVVSDGVDVIPFTAGSAVRSFASAWKGRGPLPARVGVAAIGPTTAESVRDSGLPVHEIADPHTLEGLVEALERWARRRGQ